jgi:rhodanese-related sulfurtransferase
MKTNIKKLFFIIYMLLSVSLSTVSVQANEVLEVLKEYSEFAQYSDGSITRQQLESIDIDSIYFIDTRDNKQYQSGHIRGAVNIEWREILSRMDEIPEHKTVVLYCESGLLSSKAHLMLKIAGRDNVKVLWGGYLIWNARPPAN